MARQDINDQDEEQLDEAAEGEGEGHEQVDHKEHSVPAWIISAVAHAVILFIFSLVVMIAEAINEEAPPVKITAIDPPKKVEEKPKMERDLKTVDLPLDVPVDAEKPSPISEVAVEVTEFSREEDNDNPVPKGREEAKADSEMGGQGAFMAIGAGGGAAGMFGSRTGGGKKRALGKFGGGKGSESAVDAALRWFKKHQSPNGQWDVDGYPVNCTENPKCEPGSEHTDEAGDVACTGYALLCFLGAGYDHRMPSKYKATVKKGIDYMLSIQKPDGLWGGRNYEHAVAVMAMAEAYAMSNDPALKGPAQKGVEIVLKRQTPEAGGGYGLGWDYEAPNADRMDSSVSGWNVMALKSAAAGGLSVANGMEGAKNWLRKSWEASNKDFKKLDPYGESRFAYTWSATSGNVEISDTPGSGHHDLSCVGLICAVFLGHKSGDIMLDTLANYNLKYYMPKGYPTNTYYMYYNTLGIFQVGGEKWDKWNAQVRDLLVNAQRKSNDCFDGSWDSEGTIFHGHKTGRILSTAYCCLSLEVYYRYLPVAAGKK